MPLLDLSFSDFRCFQQHRESLSLLFLLFILISGNVVAQGKSSYGQVIQSNNPAGSRPVLSNAVSPNTVSPNTIAPNQMAPNTIYPSVTEPNRMLPNTVPSSAAQYTPNPDGSLPVRPGAVVNPRSATNRNPTQEQVTISGSYGAQPYGIQMQHPTQMQGTPQMQGVPQTQNPTSMSGRILQTTGSQSVDSVSGHGIIRADNIPNTGTPGGTIVPIQPTTPQPARPPLSTAKTGQPFPPLTPEQLAELNQFLNVWEQKTSQTKRFEAKFRCFQYGTDLLIEKTGAATNTPDYCTYGWLRYVAPNKAVFNVEGEILDKKEVPGRRQEKFIITEQSIFSYDFDEKKRTEYRIPPDQQGTQLSAAGPLPIVFGAKAEDLKKRYYLQLITPEKVKGAEIHLEVWPRWTDDADEFRCVQLIVDAKTLVPKGLVKFGVNGKERTTYVFDQRSIRIDNRLDTIRDFLAEHFKPDIGLGWKTEVRDLPSSPESSAVSNSTSNPGFSQGVGTARTQPTPTLNNPQPNYGTVQQGAGQPGVAQSGLIQSSTPQPPLEVPLYVPNVPPNTPQNVPQRPDF